MQHLEEGEIHAWLDGALSEAEGARIEQHAATCRECAAMVADARGLIAGAARIVSALDHVPSGVIPKSGTAATASRPLWRALRLTPFRAAMAASLVVAAGSLIVVQRKDKELMVPRVKMIATPTVASAPAPAVPPPVADKVQRADAPAANEARQLDQSTRRSPQQSVSKTTLALQDTALLMKPAAPVASPAPAPKVASVEDERAKKERDAAALSAIVVTTAPANAAGGAARDVAPGQAQAQAGQTKASAREQSRDSVRPDIALRRAVPPALLRVEATSGFAATEPTSFIGCYQAADTAKWPRAFPSRFALVVDSSGGRAQFPIKRLLNSGPPDSVTIGSWRALTPTSARVDLNTIALPAWFTLTRSVTGYAATMSSTSASVIRLDCPR